LCWRRLKVGTTAKLRNGWAFSAGLLANGEGGFARVRLDGLYDEPRPGAPRQIGDDEIADTIRRMLESRSRGRTHWSLRSMAEAVGHAPSTIHRIWKA
jgi:homeodomain-containing protein